LTGIWLLLTTVFWEVAILCILRFPEAGALVRNRAWMLGSGVLLLAAAWISLVALKRTTDGPLLILWMLVVVWGADIGAYFVGRAIGKRKLAPKVSPGKTWEGALGGVAASLVFGGVMAWLAPLPGPVWSWLVLALGLACVSIVGDLYESVLKRAHDVKDSGGILPGHGGVLDRIDSLLAVLPIFALIVELY